MATPHDPTAVARDPAVDLDVADEPGRASPELSTSPRRDAGRAQSGRSVAPQLRRAAAAPGPRAQRTIDRILATTKEILLTRGYAGTTIDDLTRSAGISRASFYTYFPSKRDVLLALGMNAHRDARAVIARLGEVGGDWTLADLRTWIAEYFALLDLHGSFALAFIQAAHEDEELLRAGRPNLMNLARRLGLIMDALRGHPTGDPTLQGLLATSMLDRMWWLWRLEQVQVEMDELLDNTALALAALLDAPERLV
jgi:AcrR family transcriptional regulator